MTYLSLPIIGDIDEDAFSAFVEAISDERNIHITLTSHGGDAQVGLAFYDYIQSMVRVGCKVEIDAYGCVDSAAVVILAAGSKRRMSRRCRLMVHEGSQADTLIEENDSTSVLEKRVAQARREEDEWDSVLEEATGTKAEVWKRLHQDETYLTAEECLRYGIIDAIIGG